MSPLIVTIDDIDLTYGRIALLLSLAGSTPGGRFGILPNGSGLSSDPPMTPPTSRPTIGPPPFSAPGAPIGLTPGSTLDRAASRMALITVVSRASGFIRVVVVTAVLGTSFLANTYQSANSVPNLLFELVAAGKAPRRA